MINLLSWMKSTRSILAILSMVLLIYVAVASSLGYSLGSEVLILVSTVVGGVFNAYFGKPTDTKTSTTSETSVQEGDSNPTTTTQTETSPLN